MINDKVVKFFSDVRVGDVLMIEFGNKIEKVQVNQLVEMIKKDEVVGMYEILEESYVEDFGKE